VVDITQPIVAADGEIHRYVGDELIASWKLADGIADAHCVRACTFEARKVMFCLMRWRKSARIKQRPPRDSCRDAIFAS
jgi:hypothetical protein